MYRFVNFIQTHYKQDFEQFLGTLKQSDSDPIGILDEYYTFLASGKKPLASNSIRNYLVISKDFQRVIDWLEYLNLQKDPRFPKNIGV